MWPSSVNHDGPLPGIWLVVHGQDSTNDVLVDLETECLVDLLRDPGTTKARIATLHLDDGIDEFLGRPFGPGHSFLVG